MKPHRGNVILLLGILGLIICAPLGIVAWVLGSSDLKEMNAGTMDPAGRGSTNAGRVCGVIGCVLMIIGLAIGLICGLFFGLLAAHQAVH